MDRERDLLERRESSPPGVLLRQRTAEGERDAAFKMLEDAKQVVRKLRREKSQDPKHETRADATAGATEAAAAARELAVCASARERGQRHFGCFNVNFKL